MPDQTEQTVCFADLCRSTALFETFGDETARQIVESVLSGLTGAARAREGSVVKTLGDGILLLFDSPLPASRAALQFPRRAKEAKLPSELEEAPELRVRTGLCHGPVLLEEGDAHGDAVNTAARLADWARPDQVVITKSAQEKLSGSLQAQVRPLGEVSLKGKDGPVEVAELLGEHTQSGLTVPEVPGADLGEASRKKLRVRQAGGGLSDEDLSGGGPDDEDLLLGEGPAWIGRAAQADLQVEDPRVSRLHAALERRGGSFWIEDQSTNGTYVQFGEEQPIYLRHEELQLRAEAQVSLGRPPAGEETRLLRMEVIEPSGK